MGYTGDYSLAARCLSECFATMTFVFFFFFECLLANKLLPKTKAHDLTYGWHAFGVGIAVFIPVQFLGFISTLLNPAMAFAAAITGLIDWLDWPFLALSQTLGAFIGSVAMWIYYLPQFETDPEPAPATEQDRLLRPHDDVSTAALDYVSYSARLEARKPPSGAGFLEFGRMMSASRSRPSNQRVYRVVDILGRDAVGESGTERRHSVTVPCMQHRIARLENNSFTERQATKARSDTQEVAYLADESIINVTMHPTVHILDSVELKLIQEEIHPDRTVSTRISLDYKGTIDIKERQKQDRLVPGGVSSSSKKEGEKIDEVSKDEVDPKVIASHIADQNVKLTIFCTRPARYLPISNLITEIMSTFYLVIGILFIRERVEFLYEGYEDVYKHGFIAFLFGLLIFLLVLCLGGMGVAMNPARYLAPRFAHWILPVSGKGKSEWYYAWIPIVGPMIGAVIAGYFFTAMEKLNKSDKYGRDFEAEVYNLTDMVSQIWNSSVNAVATNP